MGDNAHHMMDDGSGNMAQVIPSQGYDANVDYIISDYMERLGTRLNILETELKYAWRALDLLSQEYIKMWERLEKLEGLLYEQQSVIAQLLDFYTTGGSRCDLGNERGAILDSRLGELEVIREILGNGTVEDGLEEGVDVTRPIHPQDTSEIDLEMDAINVPDEAFYRSLNQAYREDLVGPEGGKQSQLGMIWEEREEGESSEDKELRKLEEQIRLEETQDVFSAMDYKDYRGNSPCVSEQDLAQLSRISSIDHATIEKLNELDRLSTKLQQDSFNIKQLQRKLFESPHQSTKDLKSIEGPPSEKKDVYKESDNWNFGAVRDQDQEDFILGKTDVPTTMATLYNNRPSSRLSVTESVIATDNEVAETLSGGMKTPTSPRRHSKLECSAPYTTVTGRLAYNTAVHNVETAEAAAAAASHNPFLSKNPFYISSSDFNELGSLVSVPFETVHSNTPSIFSVKSERAVSPSPSICSVRTRQDGYVGSNAQINEPQSNKSGDTASPPPPAPQDVCETFLMPMSTVIPGPQTGPSPVFLGAEAPLPKSISNQEHGRLSPKVPHSPKSPKTSPKRSKSHSSTINTAKSDSGLSSMSGWSSLEKSPGSPKNGVIKPHTLNYISEGRQIRPTSPMPLSHPDTMQLNTRPFTESDTDTIAPLQVPVCHSILPGGHHLSAFTTVKSPCSLESTEGYGTFVPAPAPASDINVSPRPKNKHPKPNTQPQSEYMYRNEQPAIYSVAGSNRQESYTSVYTSNSADYINQTIKYPDLVEPYENNEFQRQYGYTSAMPMHHSPETHSSRRKSLNRTYSTSNGSENLQNHDGYKMAMQRTMFPSGNITDALSYYPTSSRYEPAVYHLPNTDYNDPSMWLTAEGQYPVDSASTSSSIRSMETAESGYSQSPYLDQRRYPQPSPRQQPIYQNQEQIGWNPRQEIPYLELDLRNRNVPEYIVQQEGAKYYDTGVIVSQSGYISISSNMNEQAAQPTQQMQQKPKKFKRGNTFKSAMNSVSHWLPDLHLSKRHRSYSLPGNTRPEEGMPTPKGALSKSMFHKKKKKIVSTVSGILQKAKRKNFHNAQSLSDPEQSENEWSINRTASLVSEDDRSEDSCSIFSECQIERENMFEKVVTSKPKRKQESPPSVEQDTVQFETVKLSPLPLQQPESITPKTDQDTDISDHFNADEEVSGKSTGSGSSSIFATIGETKRGSDKGEDSTGSETKSFPPVTIGGGSMEFAVSRALGKYRQRQTSSSIPDEPEEASDQSKSDDKVEVVEQEEPIEELIVVQKPELGEQKSVESTNSLENHRQNSFNETDGSSPASSFRAQYGRFSKHQQSLEIPGMRGEEDDIRSMHSWRSGSRVSSRRQSTEDSIDSEDEWYCYELKKLEEMERQSALEAEMGSTLQEVEENEESFEPDEEVKEKMSFVLRELRILVKPMAGVLEEKENNLQVLSSAKHRGTNISLDEDDEEEMPEMETWRGSELPEDAVEAEEAKSDADDNSGATSGPDSPQRSISEFEEAEFAIADEFARCKFVHSQSEEELAAQAQPEISPADVPKIKIDVPVSVTTNDDIKEEAGKDAGPLGSKWKLLKALKERKAEEKSNQEKVAEATTEKEKVGMLGIMQKFYEIHVKT